MSRADNEKGEVSSESSPIRDRSSRDGSPRLMNRRAMRETRRDALVNNMAVRLSGLSRLTSLTLTRYCLQCFLCRTQAERFFFLVAAAAAVGLETARDGPSADFSLRGVDRFDLFAGIVRGTNFFGPARSSPLSIAHARPRDSPPRMVRRFSDQRERERERERERKRKRERVREGESDKQRKRQ